MNIRFLLLILVGVVAGVFAQTGLFGPVSNPLKAGDTAPDIRFEKILNSVGPASWSPANLSGQVTVLGIFPDTSHNVDACSRWNALVEQFAGKPVQFVWITGEKESSLVPWLTEHPLQGSVLHDPKGETGRSYGMEIPATVIIGADRKILGFDLTMVPQAETVTAAIEGRNVHLEAEPMRMSRRDKYKPHFPPSNTLHVTPSVKDGSGNYGGPDYWGLNGFTLKELIAEVWTPSARKWKSDSLNPIRIHLPASLDNTTRYDFSLVLPQTESKEQIYERFRQGIQDYFHIIATREEKLLDVYVVTALDRKPPAAKARPQGDPHDALVFSESGPTYEVSGDDSSAAQRGVGIAAIWAVGMEGTADEFCRNLESVLDRPVVNETHLEGAFEFKAEASETATNDFLEHLREQLGLVVTAAQRNVDILAFEPRQ